MESIFEFRGSLPEIIRNDNKIYKGNLIHYFQAIFNHAQNLCNPYHNFRHMCHVAWLCYQACLFYKDVLLPIDMRSLLIAALFHDFDHCGKTGPDIKNIERAIGGLKKHLLPEDLFEFGQIATLIRYTEFPYTIPSNKLSLCGQIIRDADLSQVFSVAWIQQSVFGLAREWEKSPLEVLKSQNAFYDSLNFSTDWAQNIFPPEVIAEKTAEVNDLLAILKEH